MENRKNITQLLRTDPKARLLLGGLVVDGMVIVTLIFLIGAMIVL